VSSKSAVIATFLLNLLVGTALQEMFAFMKKSQIMVHLLIINVTIPGVAQVFFSGLLGFLQYNIIDLSPKVRYVFGLHIDDSVNDNFFNLGYSSTYFVVNMGNLYLLMVYIGFKLCFTRATRNAKHERVVKVRDWLATDLYWGTVLSFMEESYIIISVSCVANFTRLHFNHAGLAINSILAILAMAALVVYTFFSYFWLKRNHGSLKLKSFKDKYGYLYESLHIKDTYSLMEPMV